MTRGVENTLLAHGGTEDIDIPYPARQRIVEDASQWRLQVEALEEHNANQAREIDALKFEIRELRERLAGRVYE